MLGQTKNTFVFLVLLLFSGASYCQYIFFDDFEKNLDNWKFADSSIARLFHTNDTGHKTVLRLTPNNSTDCILLKNSENWRGFQIEGEVLFPSDQHIYFGLVYNY